MKKCTAITAVVAASVLASAAPAIAGPADRTPPRLTVPAAASFVVGTRIGDSTGPDGPTPETYPIMQRARWQASDASGICGYRVTEISYGGRSVLVAQTLRTSFTRATTDYSNQQGGGELKAVAWKITARDCAGNTTSKQTIILPVVTREDGWTYGARGVDLSYTGSWGTSTCACWSGDKTRYTTAAGARAIISRTWAKGDHLALVVEKAPNRAGSP